MKTLEELNKLLADLPSPFAATRVDMDFPAAAGEMPATNYETGIPQEYARDVAASDSEESGELLPLADFNRLGNLATRELFFRRCGGKHSFDRAFSGENLGYAAGALLNFDDGLSIKAVESQEGGNDLDFAADPAVIDALANKPSDPSSAMPRILWKSAGRCYGLEEGFAHVGVDFSRRQDVGKGDALATDSLVLVGANFWGKGVWDTEAGIVSGSVYLALTFGISIAEAEVMCREMIDTSLCGDFSVEVSVDDSDPMVFPCKGMQGGSYNCANAAAYLNPLMLLSMRIYYNRFCGGANFPLAFFAKRGTKISCLAKGNGNDLPDDAVSVVAYPLVAEVSAGTEEGGAA